MDDRLKQRLLGAVVVVALAVIFVPELLKDPEEPNEPVANTEMPPRPSQTLVEPDVDETVSLPLVTESPQEPPTVPDTQGRLMPAPTHETLTPPESARPFESADGERTVTNAERGSMAQESPVTPDTATPGGTSNAVPTVGATDSPNVPAQASVSSGVPSGVDPNAAPLPPGVTRPEPSPATNQSPGEPSSTATQPQNPDTAPTASASITPSVDLPQVDLIGQSGVDNPPSVDTNDTTAMSQTGNWVVQAGSFSQPKNANDLRDELIGQGFDAFVESSDTDGQVLYRVRIGPQSSRDQGESTLARLRALGFEGQVVSLRN